MSYSAPSNTLNQQVTVTSAARLHMGFYDLTNHTGRSFGGLGLAIDTPCMQVQVSKSKNLVIDANCSENTVNIVENIIKSFNLPREFHIQILQSIPVHAGLGSGTQTALAIGAALNHLFALNLSTTQIAAATMRGKRSGIGIGAFMHGGFLVDSGKLSHRQATLAPDIAARYVFPSHWRVLLVLDAAHTGVHGAEELAAFQTLKPAPSSLRAMLDEHMLPALQHTDLLALGAHMQQLQAYNGDYFAPIQGGRYASKHVAQVLDWLQTNGAPCLGQSSWGPTGFAIIETEKQAQILLAQAQRVFADKPNISFKMVQGKNTGASISKADVSEMRILESE